MILICLVNEVLTSTLARHCLRFVSFATRARVAIKIPDDVKTEVRTAKCPGKSKREKKKNGGGRIEGSILTWLYLS